MGSPEQRSNDPKEQQPHLNLDRLSKYVYGARGTDFDTFGNDGDNTWTGSMRHTTEFIIGQKSMTN